MTILVSGLINIETTLKVDEFPIEYRPVRYPFFGIRSTVSGVGFNVAKALTTLGEDVRFLSMIGKDSGGTLTREALKTDNIPRDYVLETLDSTPQSVILYDDSGRRAINTDLKDVQKRPYPLVIFEKALEGVSLVALCNINFSRPMLAKTKSARIPIATDVHTISDLDDEYNRDFLAAADILFMSDESLPCAPEEWARKIQNRYGNEIVVIGLGAEGALLSVKNDNFMERVPASQLRRVVNTIGAGDALFSAFIYTYSRTREPYISFKKATIFASYQLGETGAAAGFVGAGRLSQLYAEIYGEKE